MNRWSAKSVEHRWWPRPFQRIERELSAHGFALCVWKRAGRTLATIGERHRAGVEPDRAEDGSAFSAIWIHAATETEADAFSSGLGAGLLVARRVSTAASQEC